MRLSDEWILEAAAWAGLGALIGLVVVVVAIIAVVLLLLKGRELWP